MLYRADRAHPRLGHASWWTPDLDHARRYTRMPRFGGPILSRTEVEPLSSVRCWGAGLGRPRRHSVARSVSSPSVAPSSHAPPERQVPGIQQRELEPAWPPGADSGGIAQPAVGRSLFGGGADRGVVLGAQVLRCSRSAPWAGWSLCRGGRRAGIARLRCPRTPSRRY
jgi:hypothetical protein